MGGIMARDLFGARALPNGKTIAGFMLGWLCSFGSLVAVYAITKESRREMAMIGFHGNWRAASPGSPPPRFLRHRTWVHGPPLQGRATGWRWRSLVAPLAPLPNWPYQARRRRFTPSFP
jgi:hypothetical protein